MAIPMSYEDRLDMIMTNAWERWTKNGLGLDDDMRHETARSVHDAACNAYVEDVTDAEWLATTLKLLGAQ
jgi:hypothetical protein